MPTKIKLPAFLEEKIQDSTHEPEVRKALKDFGKWFGDESKQTFFPDYTNHGVQHIEQVLATASNLVPKKARPVFSAADAVALILAVLLHDSALHLSKAGFWYLIKGGAPHAPVDFFDRDDWGKAWSDFMFLARRWDDTMLLNVFGEEENTGSPRAQVRDPFDHWSNLTETDGLLIGEFIRKHHPRLAHEMALYGVPGKDGIYLKLADDLPGTWRDLAGLLARSHGLPLRTSLDYLRDTPHFGTTGPRNYQNVHAVYLMALLRVADYIQIQGDRTSEKIFTFKDIPSRVSQLEHKAHLSDILISADAEDPESLQIDAHPAEVAIFLRLKEWLAGIQQELDSSWAVMGEVYGRYKDLRKLGLTFRRVRSNLDDVAEFAKTVPYVPDRIRFDVARAELLKLLIGPLYGDDPSYGVRELMQNSIDAVREYDQFVLDNPQYKDVLRREQEADVVVELGPLDEATGYAVMTISDRGIGMTEATIRDYFLKAGASYRQSAEWRAAFEASNAEDKGSKILRSGRFGVGALAAFLIGNEITVQTRYAAAKDGYTFKTNLETESINVKHKSLPVGTSINVKVASNVYESLMLKHQRKFLPSRFNWYVFDEPKVLRKWPGLVKKVDVERVKKFSLKSVVEKKRKLIVNLPYDVYWTLNSAPVLTCNGFFVSNSESLRYIPYEISGHNHRTHSCPVEYPLVSIIDPNGKLPLNLQRNGIRGVDYDFAVELVHDILNEMLGWLLFNGPNKLNSSYFADIPLPWLANYGRDSALVASKDGYAVILSVIMDGLPIRHLINYWKNGFELELMNTDTFVTSRINLESNYFANLLVVDGHNGESKVASINREVIYFHPYDDKKAPRGSFKKSSYIIYEKPKYNLEHQKRGWLTIKQLGCPEKEFSISKWPIVKIDSPYARGAQLPYFEEKFFPADSYLKSESEPWLLDEIWQEHFGREWIPFDLKERLVKFPKAAQFFAERYPQVVPDEAWALLGGKPATT